MINNLNADFKLNGLGYSNAEDTVECPRHRWYFIKEGFSPVIVEKAIEESQLEPKDLIIDPFSGSGTVSVVAALKKQPSISFEVNPFLAFLSRTKLIQVEQKQLNSLKELVLTGINQERISPLENFSSFSSKKGNSKWLFNKSILRAFEGGWRVTEGFDSKARKIFQLILLGSAMDNCNASRDGKCLRYKKDWQELQFHKEDFLEAFDKRFQIVLKDLNSCPLDIDRSNSVILGDSRKVLEPNLTSKFKLCITSPPYLNSFDYSDIYRPELFLGKFINTQAQLVRLRHKTLRSHVQVKWKEPTEDDFGAMYIESITAIKKKSDDLWNKNISLMIQAYFEDMNKILKELRGRAQKGASVWVVVSTSAYVGVEIPVDLIIAEIGTRVGWYLREVGVLRYLRSSAQHAIAGEGSNKLRESVVILDASPK